MIVERQILEILDRAETSGDRLRLSAEPKLDRAVYLKVAKVIELAGGKWDRRSQSHVFDGPAGEALEPVMLTGEITSTKSEFGFFETPDALARDVVALAEISPRMEVLEPSAGRGALARHALAITGQVDAVEIQRKNFEALLDLDPRLRTVQCADFLALTPRPIYDRVVMNPPFAKRADVKHIRKAFGWLRPGGRLLSIASASVQFRSDSLGSEFREWVETHHGICAPLPDGSFKESGTSVNAVLIAMVKPRTR